MTNSYCFHEAVLSTRPSYGDVPMPQISEEEWMEHLVAHMRGIRHELDEEPDDPWLHVFDPIGNSVRVIALKEGYQPLNGMNSEQESETYKRLLVACLHGQSETVKDIMDRVQALRAPHLSPLQPVATIAAEKGHVSILDFALAKGAQLDHDLCVALRRGQYVNQGMKELFLKHSQAITEVLNKPVVRTDRFGTPIGPGFDPGDRFDDIDW